MSQALKNNNKINHKNETTFLQQLNTKAGVNAGSDTKNNETSTVNYRFYYSVDSFNILLEQDIKAENLSLDKIYELPYPPSWCIGIVNVRGIIVPVVDMNILLETTPKTATRKTKHLLLQHEDFSPIVLQINKLPTMIDFDNYNIGKISEKINEKPPGWSIKQLRYESNIIHEVKHKELLKQLYKGNLIKERA